VVGHLAVVLFRHPQVVRPEARFHVDDGDGASFIEGTENASIFDIDLF